MPQQTTHRKDEDAVRAPDLMKLDRQLCFAVYSTAHAFTRAYKPLLDKLGLTYPQYLVMLVLWEKNGLSVKDIGLHLGLDSGTLSPLLKRLEKSSLIVRKRDQNDERQVIVALTEQGKTMKAEAQSIVAPAIVKAVGCNGAEASELRERLNNLRATLDGTSCHKP